MLLNYKIKTAFHEAYHAKANGLKVDLLKDRNKWLQIEETFAETSAHFLYKQLGLSEEISLSYSDKLVEMLPRLKQLDKFKDCKTLGDFGSQAWADRLNGVPAEWINLYDEAMKVNHDWKAYATKHFSYMNSNKEELIDLMLNNMPQYRAYKNHMIQDFDNAVNKINSSASLSSNESLVTQNMLAITMNRLGVE